MKEVVQQAHPARLQIQPKPLRFSRSHNRKSYKHLNLMLFSMFSVFSKIGRTSVHGSVYQNNIFHCTYYPTL